MLCPYTAAWQPESSILYSGFGPPIQLPDDYLAFMNVFGAGCFTNERYTIFVLDLTRCPDRRTEVVWESSCDGRQYRLGEQAYRAYPEFPGVLPWGCDDQGLTFLWLVDGPLSTWKTAVGRVDYELYNLGMAELMVECVVRRIFFYDDTFGDDITFIPRV
ncbi:hypothetical protein [Novipirellula maiorica]|uniref:hypothetical protein n=1 Tax=Novipirellula maiorica TaxID=1265734 RepID=UPI0005948307|nr:hypothetical protein [Rhodopirellula maiorica]